MIKQGNLEGLHKLFQFDDGTMEQVMHEVDRDGNTPLHISAMRANNKFIKFFLQKDVSPHVQNSKGETALEICVEFNKRNCVRSLLRAGTQVPREMLKKSLDKMQKRIPNISGSETDKMRKLVLVASDDIGEDSDTEAGLFLDYDLKKNRSGYDGVCKTCKKSDRVIVEQRIRLDVLESMLHIEKEQRQQDFEAWQKEKKELIKNYSENVETMQKNAKRELEYQKRELERVAHNTKNEENVLLAERKKQMDARLKAELQVELRATITKEFQEKFDKLHRDNEYFGHVIKKQKKTIDHMQAKVAKTDGLYVELHEIQEARHYAVLQRTRLQMQLTTNLQQYRANALLLKYMSFKKFVTEFKLKKRLLASLEGWGALLEDILTEEGVSMDDDKEQSELENWQSSTQSLLRLSRSRLKGYARRVSYQECLERILDVKELIRTWANQMMKYAKHCRATNGGFVQRVAELTSYSMKKEEELETTCKKVEAQKRMIAVQSSEIALLRQQSAKAETYIKKLYSQMARQRGGNTAGGTPNKNGRPSSAKLPLPLSLSPSTPSRLSLHPPKSARSSSRRSSNHGARNLSATKRPGSAARSRTVSPNPPSTERKGNLRFSPSPAFVRGYDPNPELFGFALDDEEIFQAQTPTRAASPNTRSGRPRSSSSRKKAPSSKPKKPATKEANLWNLLRDTEKACS